MKIDNPQKTSSGCVHHTSARIVWPNDRRGAAAVVVPFIRRLSLQSETLLFSTLPNYRAHSKDFRSLPLSKCSPRCWRDNRFRNKRPSVSRDRVHLRAFVALAKKRDAHQGRARSSIRAENAHRQFAV